MPSGPQQKSSKPGDIEERNPQKHLSNPPGGAQASGTH
jgi:hypothetical protein